MWFPCAALIFPLFLTKCHLGVSQLYRGALLYHWNAPLKGVERNDHSLKKNLEPCCTLSSFIYCEKYKFQINMAGWIVRHGQAAWRVRELNTPRDKVISDKAHWSCPIRVGATVAPCRTSTTPFCRQRSQKKRSKYWWHANTPHTLAWQRFWCTQQGGWVGRGLYCLTNWSSPPFLLCFILSLSLSLGLMNSGRLSTDAANEPASPSSS